MSPLTMMKYIHMSFHSSLNGDHFDTGLLNYILTIKNELTFIAGTEGQFMKYSRNEIDSLGVVYDYGSVMHYSKKAFSSNGQDTIVPKMAGVVSVFKCK